MRGELTRVGTWTKKVKGKIRDDANTTIFWLWLMGLYQIAFISAPRSALLPDCESGRMGSQIERETRRRESEGKTSEEGGTQGNLGTGGQTQGTRERKLDHARPRTRRRDVTAR
jgi:hypothetical protein